MDCRGRFSLLSLAHCLANSIGLKEDLRGEFKGIRDYFNEIRKRFKQLGISFPNTIETLRGTPMKICREGIDAPYCEPNSNRFVVYGDRIFFLVTLKCGTIVYPITIKHPEKIVMSSLTSDISKRARKLHSKGIPKIFLQKLKKTKKALFVSNAEDWHYRLAHDET